MTNSSRSRGSGQPASSRVRRLAQHIERRWDSRRLARRAALPPQNLRIVPYCGHGSGSNAVVRGRVLDDPEWPAPAEGEPTWRAIRRTLARFDTHELPGVPLFVRLGGTIAETETDDEGYYDLRLEADLAGGGSRWVEGEVGLRTPYRGLAEEHTTRFRIRVSGPDAGYGVISDVDDTILHTGTQRAMTMLRRTLTGSAVSRAPVAGAAELYRGLAAGRSDPEQNPLFYVSSSPWNLYGFLADFLEYRRFPPGPLLLRDFLGNDQDHSHRSHKTKRIEEILELHPELDFVLIGDSGQDDPAIYAQTVRRHPERIVAVYIREARLQRGDDRMEAILDGWNHPAPLLLAPDPVVMAEHAAGLGLIDTSDVEAVRRAT